MGQPFCGNINPVGRRIRFMLGIIIYIAAYVWALSSFNEGMVWWGKLLLWPLFFLGTLCLLQAKNRTCVFLAASGTAESRGEGRKPHDPAHALEALRVSKRILLLSAAYSLAIAAVCWWAL